MTVSLLNNPSLQTVRGAEDAWWWGLVTVLAWIVGLYVHRHRQARALEQLAARLERERDEHARLATARERSRVARELHDVVSHGVSLIALPRTRVVMLTTFDLHECVYEAMRAGASGFLLKDAPREDLVAGVRAAAAGDTLLAPEITRRLVEAYVRRPPPGPATPAPLAELTDREVEILRLVARGLSNAEIAASLFLSEATVKTHVSRVLAKLDLRNRVQAVVRAYECGLVQPGG
jgi:DNA-binding NarL/FixJ family response regulator